MIYVDDMNMVATVGRVTGVWSHLFSDTSLEELELFARELKLNPEWLQNSAGFYHYDVVTSVKARALRQGAKLVSYRNVPDMFNRKGATWTYKSKTVP